MGVLTMRYLRWVLAALIVGAVFGGCASQKDVHTLDSRVQVVAEKAQQSNRNIESRIDDLEKNMIAREQEIRQQAARIRAAQDRFIEDLALLRGSLEEVEHRINQQIVTLENAERAGQGLDAQQAEEIAALKAQTLRIEEYLNLSAEEASAAGAIPPAPGEDEKKEKAALSAKDMYALAKQAYDNGSLETARQGFEALIKAYPDAPQADNAQFWIGETYYREKWFEKAILEYHKVIKNYPKGNKVPAALLKQGFAFSQLKDATNARLVLSELVKKYPKTNEAAIARKKLDRLQ
jgi:tol-pal system protein YbgF